MQENEFKVELEKAYRSSLKNSFLWMVHFDDFLKYQETIRQRLGDDGFIMYTDKRAVFCLRMAPSLHIYLISNDYYTKESFKNLCFKNLQILGKGKKELPSLKRQYFIDIKDNIFKIIVVTILFFSIFNLEKINIDGIVALSDSLVNAISIFTGIVFVFIGFIYSDKERAISIYLRGNGDQYYHIDKYIMSLSILCLFSLIFISAVGRLTYETIPQFLINLQKNSVVLDWVISYKSQYYICLFVAWFSLCSMVICFSALTDYYLNDLRYNFFIDAVKKKSKEF